MVANRADKAAIKTNSKAAQQQLQTLQKRLKITWLLWLGYRGVLFSILLNIFLSASPNVIGGITWQLLLLLPALLLTPWMLRGSSPYALLLGSMVTLIYLGESGVTLFSIFYSNGVTVWWVYALDTWLILLINVGMFKLLKVLPSMNSSNADT